MDGRIVRHDVVDSTSERAFAELARGAARHFDVHTALEQTRGRGRLGRTWHSARGEGLYASIVLLPRAPLSAPGLTMTLGLAVLDAVRALGLANATLDWPNDLVVPRPDGTTAKLAGCLVETRGLDAQAPHYVAGVGLNVAQRSFAPELLAERAVTSLALEGVATDVERALDALLAALAPLVALLERDPESIAARFAREARVAGRMVRLSCGDRVVEGRLVALSLADGASVASSSGSIERFPLELVRSVDPLR